MSSDASSRHLHIHLLTYHESDMTTFETALEAYPLPDTYTFSKHTGALRLLDPSVNFDLAVSPANSYGLMDGSFDDALSRAFSPKGDYNALTRVVQKKLWQTSKGFAVPGTCTLVPFNFSGTSDGPRGCRMIAVCPTMRTPQVVEWDREIVYECIWSLLCAIERWNKDCEEKERIRSILMTPLATGVGRVSAWKWATQALLAMRHFDEACSNESSWSSLDWKKAGDMSTEVEATHNM